MRKTLLAAFLTLLSLPGWAAETPQSLIDNPRVTVRDITLAPGDGGVATDPDHPFVVLFLDGGDIRTTKDGQGSVATYASDDALYGAKGTPEKLEAVSGHPHFVLVTLKEDAATPPLPNTTGFPLAFPRPRVKKVLENDRVIVWAYTWLPGQPTPMHFHDKDVVVAYHQDGDLSSTTPDGKTVVNPYRTGNIKFNPGNRSHFENLIKGQQSAIMMELK